MPKPGLCLWCILERGNCNHQLRCLQASPIWSVENKTCFDMFCRYRFPKLMTCNVFRHRFSLMEISRNRSGEASCWKTSCWLFFGRQSTIYCPVWIQFIFHLVKLLRSKMPCVFFLAGLYSKKDCSSPQPAESLPKCHIWAAQKAIFGWCRTSYFKFPKSQYHYSKCFSKCPSPVRCWFINPVNYSSLHLTKTIEK